MNAPSNQDLLLMSDIELEAWDVASWRMIRAIKTIREFKKLKEGD